jgi:hypothetical protein
VLLCRYHHRKVHEGGVLVQVLDDGAFRFVRPDGRAFDSPAPERGESSDWTQLPLQHRDGDIRIDRNTAVTRWRGERMDYGLAIDVLLAQAQRARDVPAGSGRVPLSVSGA